MAEMYNDNRGINRHYSLNAVLMHKTDMFYYKDDPRLLEDLGLTYTSVSMSACHAHMLAQGEVFMLA